MEDTKFYLKIFALLILLYVGTYSLLVEKQTTSEIEFVWNRVWGVSSETEPDYHWGGATAELSFIPIHWIDRRIRREYWSNPEIIPIDQTVGDSLINHQ